MSVASNSPTTGKPTFNDVSTTQADIQAAADFAELFAHWRVGPTTDRNNWTTVHEGTYWDDTTDLIVYRYTGGAWVPWWSQWKTFTPTLTGITLGTGGTVAAKYRYDFGYVIQDVLITLGSAGAAVGTLPTVTLPVNAAPVAVPLLQYEGTVIYYQNSGGGDYNGQVGAPSGDNTKVRLLAWPNSSGLVQAVTAAAPFAWSNNDKMWLRFRYPTS
jgi:hypothetical protein